MTPQVKDWIKPLATAIITGLVTAGTMLYGFGKTQQQQEDTRSDVVEHLKITEPKQEAGIHLLEGRVLVLETNYGNLEKYLERIEKQNGDIIKLLQSKR